MAEAHQAVVFAFNHTDEGIQIEFDHTVLRQVYFAGIRNYKKRLGRLKNRFLNRCFPMHPTTLVISVVGSLSAAVIGKDISFGAVQYVSNFLLRHTRLNQSRAMVLSSTLFGTGVFMSFAYFYQRLIKTLLSYHGWMYESRGPMSLKTKVWYVMSKMLINKNPGLYSYQSTLPKLPLPSIDATVERYLTSMEPLLEPEKMEETKKLAKDFRTGIGRKLQFYLRLKYYWTSNYVSDWWEEFVYLYSRDPIMVNSNYYGLDAIFILPTHVQTARAGNIAFAMLSFWRQIAREELKPLMIQNTVPLCSWQYERLFATTRIPGEESDSLIHLNDTRHIAVLHAGRFYKVYFYYKNNWLQPCELEAQFIKILNDSEPPKDGEAQLAAITAGERKVWARARKDFFHRGKNKTSLDAIEKAAFVVVLDSEEADYDPKDDSQLDKMAKLSLHGDGTNRWFDKSFNIIVYKNGRIACNCEHSFADAPIMAQLWEDSVFTFDVDIDQRYDSQGHCQGEPINVPNPIRLQWDISEQCKEVIDSQLRIAKNLLGDVDMHLVVHQKFGKGIMKKCKVSPDAFVQLALQLAYFRDSKGKFCLTYEASMTRLFKEGRTETVRSCTNESSAFVRAMEDPKQTREERIKLLRIAADYHQKLYRDAMTGKGVDRHLFTLYVVSKYLKISSPFLDEALQSQWRLSTSQTPHGQMGKVDLAKNPDYISPGGGFGPVSSDGYGVSYIFAGDDILFFHVSSRVSCDKTNSKRFGNMICKALQDLTDLFEVSKA